ncbi:MAG: LysR substrate-binding domain-containing protein [Candidatus Eisenbacteria bacterium]|nr:LysR substrate-binding domain-containing protein [Candidatus Eisenbacteria bacterium]
MDSSRRRQIWLLFRLMAYLAVLILLFQARRSVDWRHLFSRARTEGAVPNTLTLAGVDLASELLLRLVDGYRRDYPRVQVLREGGGTNRALELLINRRCDVAFTLRPATALEQRLFLEATGDTVVVMRIALGGLVLVAATGHPGEELGLSDLRGLALSGPLDGIDRLYAPDPNSGLWASFLAGLAPHQPDSARGPNVIFLSDQAAVLDAVSRDPRSIGLASSLSLPENLAGSGVRAMALSGIDPGAASERPDYESIGAGRYPLFHYLYAVSRPGGGLEGDMFLTHLTSSRVQRQIERAGYLPARQALRAVALSFDPIGNPK